MKNIFFLLLLIILQCDNKTLAQTNLVSGRVIEMGTNQKEQTVVGANVYWANTQNAVQTDVDGRFSIAAIGDNTRLVVSFVGYENDTINLEQGQNNFTVILQNGIELGVAEIRAKQGSTFISTLKPIKTEIITTQEIRKAACCNLSESFETNASVDVEYSDAVSGAKEIRLLGLDGVYVQMLTEGIPTLRGLASTFGLTYIPGAWLESIHITKGSGSVVNGYEPITGQINIEYQKPEKAPRLHLNLYGNQMGRAEMNLNLRQKIDESWSTMLLLHGANMNAKVDHNEDGFLDMPRTQTYTAINRWKYQGKKVESMFGLKGLLENRQAGQSVFDPKQPRTTTNGYGIGIDTRRAEAFAKTGLFLKKCHQSIGTMLSFVYHEQDMFFGLKNYDGKQLNFFANIIYESIIKDKGNGIKMGGSYMYDQYRETYNDTLYARTESVPGVFVEYTRKKKENFTAVVGLRADYHNLYGFQFTPRLHLRYQVTPNTTFRASAGRGFRVANIFAENTAIFASGRELELATGILPESAWNEGINLTQKIKIGEREGHFSVDLYRTDFENQLVTDVYSSTDKIRFYNLEGKSFANSIQAELGYEVLKGFDVKIAYKFDDVRTTFKGMVGTNGSTLMQVPFISRQKALLNLAYETPNKHWRFDFTTQWHGSKNLALNANTNDQTQMPTAPSHFILLGQITYAVKQWEFYAGGENLSNFTQKNPIANAGTPFANTFDASNVWGPVYGAMVYAGLRFTLE